MSTILSINELEIGQTISFKSISTYDTVEWRAKIIAFSDYELVKNLQDVLPYYQNVKKTNAGMLPIDKLSYMVLTVYENDLNISNRRVFAKEWIDPSSLKLINLSNYIDVRIFDIEETKIQIILDLIFSNGYSCTRIIKS